MPTHNLHSLLEPWGINAPYTTLQEITLDTRKIKEGSLFLAVKGHQTDGRKYISQAIEKGVVAIIAEAEEETRNGKIQYIQGVPVVYINDLNKKLSFLASEFYQHPANNLRLVGITGTNGKTTTSHLIAQWAKELGELSAIMGTLGNGILGKTLPSKNTTGSAVDVQAELDLFRRKKVTLVVMEVSSHALVQSRVAAIPFTATIFTNLSLDHLDYHIDMKNYAEAKWMLFSKHKSRKQIINMDDNIGLEWIKKIPKACAVSIQKFISKNWKGSFVLVKKIKYHDYKTTIYFNSSWGKGSIKSPLIGDFNVSNIMLAMATLLMMGYPLNAVIKSSQFLETVFGRMEFFNSQKKPTVVIDYAHTPDALKKVLATLRFHCSEKLWCIFGCGGDRDKGKRAIMGRVAEKYSDIVILTDDNPRNETSETIINDILSGFRDPNKAIAITNRIEAISTAIMQAKSNDLILVAGKGHEDYQIIGNRQIKYSDRLTVKQLLGIYP